MAIHDLTVMIKIRQSYLDGVSNLTAVVWPMRSQNSTTHDGCSIYILRVLMTVVLGDFNPSDARCGWLVVCHASLRVEHVTSDLSASAVKDAQSRLRKWICCVYVLVQVGLLMIAHSRTFFWLADSIFFFLIMWLWLSSWDEKCWVFKISGHSWSHLIVTSILIILSAAYHFPLQHFQGRSIWLMSACIEALLFPCLNVHSHVHNALLSDTTANQTSQVKLVICQKPNRKYWQCIEYDTRQQVLRDKLE